MMKNVLIANNLYCLFIYLLLKKQEDITSTFFFFTNNIPDSIVLKFKHKIKILIPSSLLSRFLLVLKLRFLRYLKFSFISETEIYGQDNLLISSPLVGNKSMCILEDGVGNYTKMDVNRKFRLLKRIIGGKLMSQNPLGLSTCVNKIYLTGLAPIPEVIKDKVELIDLNTLWINSPKTKQEYILSIFSSGRLVLDNLKEVDSVLFTQPLSEDHAIDEITKIALYKKIIGNKKIVIKPHPREKTNYKVYFPNSNIIEPQLPIQLLSLCGLRIKNVYTIFSTAALNLPGNPHVFFTGTTIHPALVKKWGKIELRNGVVTRID